MLVIPAYSKVVRYAIRQIVLIRCCFVMSVTVVRLSTFLFALVLWVLMSLRFSHGLSRSTYRDCPCRQLVLL